MENKICVYAISKNEEQFVERWYDSMKEADAVVVLDTGSTDNTAQKLRDLGVTVEVKEIKPWRFDVARNESLKLVPDDCNILICTDLDEVLEPGWSKPLREKWIEGTHQRGVYKYSWSHLEDGSSGRVFRYDKIHSREWEWKAPVHELLYRKNSTTDNMYFPHETLDLFDDIHLHHYPDKNKSRGSYLPLLELRAEEDPEDYYGLIYLAHEYYYRAKYDKAINLLKRILSDYRDKYNIVEQSSCYLFLGDGYKSLGDQEEDSIKRSEWYDLAKVSYLSAIRTCPDYIEPYLDLSKVLMAENDYQSAEMYIKKGLKNSYRHFTWLERDSSWSFEPWDLLCLATFYGGKKRDSIAYAAKALSFEPTNERLQSNLNLCIEYSSDEEII